MQQNYNDEINLLDYWNVIKRRKRLIGLIVGTVTVVTVIVSLVTPKYYKAQAVIMPVGKGGGGGLAALAGQFGGLASLAGLGGAGGQAPSQQFMALLKTRTLAEEMINRHNLMSVLFKKTKAEAEVEVEESQRSKVKGEDINERRTTNDERRKKGQAVEDAVKTLLGSYVKFMDDKKNGTITISAEFKDPKLAAEVANGYVDGLQKFINENAFTVAKRNRIFIEGQLAQNKRELLEAGKELNEFYKGGRVSSVESKIDVPIANSNTQAVLGDLQKQKEEIENKIVKDIPQQVYLQYLTLRRNLLTQINTLLTQQYEMAKIDEAKDELAFQVIDPARVPEKRSRPKRRQMVMLAFASSLFIGVFAAFFMEYLEKVKAEAKVKERV